MFDLIIIGGSAAAATAGIYAARRNLNFKIITKEFGGEVATSGEIGNWPGQATTDGIKLAQEFKDHLKSYNVVPEEEVWVEKITHLEDGTFRISANNEREYMTKAIIITTGVHPKLLNIPGEKEYRGKGVTYCTVCDGPLFPGKVVATIGGGNGALESALMLAGIASKVYLVNKNDKFKGDDILIEKVQASSNVEIVYNTITKEILGDKFVTGLKYEQGGEVKDIKLEGVFIHIGNIPNSDLVPTDVEKDKFGQIIINQRGETNISGLYAAGDVTDIPFKQIVIAAGQGCVAALSAVEYLNRK